MHLVNRTAPLRRLRKDDRKPPMPENLEARAASARKRHAKRHANPGVAVEVEKVTASAYRLASPHSDTEAWHAMVCDALGTRSEATATTFLYQLTELCSRTWHPNEVAGGGEWVPDECELNMVLNMVASIKPRNEIQAALAAQLVAVHLMTMKVASRCLRIPNAIDPQLAAVAGKLARTFAVQTDALARLQGRKTSHQKITVSYEKHEHQHILVDWGEKEIESQPHARDGDALVAALLGKDASGSYLPLTGNERETGVSDARRKESRSATGSRKRGLEAGTLDQ